LVSAAGGWQIVVADHLLTAQMAERIWGRSLEGDSAVVKETFMLVQATAAQTAPVQAMPVQTTLARPVEAEALSGAQTILLVEDEAFVREVTCEVLRSAGYRVLTAKNAAEAVSLYDARYGEVELLLTDVVLPGETGRALAGRFRRENPELQVLLVTGYGEQMGLLEAKQETKWEATPEECLAKPFSSEVLLRRVKQLLGCKGSCQDRR
jgi:two-component system, cell cycle sensor histidine kinase and response regulator CckA